jgi:hypothetical protein
MLVQNTGSDASGTLQGIAISQNHVTRLESLALSFCKSADSVGMNEVEIPVYTDDSRQQRVTSILFDTSNQSITHRDFDLRHVAFIAHELIT